MKNGKKEVYAFDATVDSGKWDKERAQETGMGIFNNKGEYKGIANIADGFYQDAFQKGAVSGSDLGLKQSGWLRYQLDSNGDGKISAEEKIGKDGKGRAVGAAARFQFHPGWGDKVGENSAGCQAIRGEQWDQFQTLLKDAPESQKKFSYTLVDGKELKDVSAEDMQKKADDARTSWGNKTVNIYGNEIKIYERDAVNVWNNSASLAEQKAAEPKPAEPPKPKLNFGFNFNFNINFAAEGRGFVGDITDASVIFNKETDSVLKAFVNYKGDDGIGIIRQPFPSFRNKSYCNKWYM